MRGQHFPNIFEGFAPAAGPFAYWLMVITGDLLSAIWVALLRFLWWFLKVQGGRFWAPNGQFGELGGSWQASWGPGSIMVRFRASKQDQDRGMLGRSWSHVAAKSEHFWFEIAFFEVSKGNVNLSSSWNRFFNDFEAGLRWPERHFVL